MRVRMLKILKPVLIATLCAGLASCDDPQVYGSVTLSSYGGGGYYGPGYGPGYRPGYPSRYGSSVTIGGRIR